MLLSLLQTRRDWPGQLLAARLDISHRTVRRDVDRLRDLGYNIHATMGPDGGYRLDAGSELPPLLFDDEQALALAVALQSVTVVGAGVDEAALRALSTVRQVMPAHLRHRMDALQFIPLVNPTHADVDPAVLVALSAAVRAREVLRFDYASSDELRQAEPHHLVTSNGRWYLVAWDLDRDDWRIFRADRVTPRTHRGARFSPREVPGGHVADFVSARFKGSNLDDRWPCRGTVILSVPASTVRPYVGDGLLEDLGPDRCRLELGSWSWLSLAASIGRFDADVEVVSPPELAAAFGELAGRYARAAVTPERVARQPLH
jgi:predicted DNA-binding transcriptional regulator YafY